MIGQFIFSESTPSSPGTAASSQAVANAASYLPAGVAGPLDDYTALRADIDVPANTTSGAIDLVLQTSPDSGVTWYDFARTPTIAKGSPAIAYAVVASLQVGTTTTTQVGKGTATALAVNTVVGGPFGSRMRLVMTAGAGASSSITVTVRVSAQRKRARELGSQ